MNLRRGYHILPLAVTLAIVTGAFVILRDNYLLGSLVLAGIYAIAIMGLVILVGLNGQFSLGHAAFFGMGAYSGALLAKAGYPAFVTLPVGGLFAAIVAMIVGYPLLRLRGYYLAVATLALGLITLSILNGWRVVTLGPSGISEIPPLSIGSFQIVGEQANYWAVWLLVTALLWMALNLRDSRIGQATLAIKRDETAAAAMGINVHLVKVKIFGLSAAFAGLAGAFYAQYVTFISPERFGTVTSFELLLAALLGGTGTPFGAIIGALLLIALPEAVAFLRDYKTIVYGLVFIVLSLYMPHGIAGLGNSLIQAWRERGASSTTRAQQSEQVSEHSRAP